MYNNPDISLRILGGHFVQNVQENTQQIAIAINKEKFCSNKSQST